MAFSKAWALEHGVAVRTGQQPAAEAADTNGAAARTETTAAEPTSASGDSDSTGPRKLFDLVSEQVTTTWSSEQLAESLPDFLLEEIYAAAGKASVLLPSDSAHVRIQAVCVSAGTWQLVAWCSDEPPSVGCCTGTCCLQ